MTKLGGAESKPEPRTSRLGRLVVDALASLHDLRALQTNPLVNLLALNDGRDGQSRAEQLRISLLDAIEATRPPGNGAAGSPPRRRYKILKMRYFDSMEVKDIEKALAISHSEYYRDIRAALDCVVTFWSERSTSGKEGRPAAPSAARPAELVCRSLG